MTDETKHILDTLGELIKELSAMADEYNNNVNAGEGGVHLNLYNNAYAAGVLGACLKVCEKKEAILRAEQKKVTGSDKRVLPDIEDIFSTIFGE